MTSRLEILSDIDTLYDANCASCIFKNDTSREVCGVCPVAGALEKLGDKLLQERRDKLDALLAKGLDMTRSDIEHLLSRGIYKTEIKNVLGIKMHQLTEFLDGPQSHRKPVPYKSFLNERTGKLVTRRELILDLHKQGYNADEIAVKADVQVTTVKKYVREDERKREKLGG